MKQSTRQNNLDGESMGKLIKRIRGALGMGLTWAALWAAGGLLLGLSSNLFPFLPWHYFFEIFDAPLPALAVPGFVGGILFSLVVGIAGRGSRLSELSMSRFVTWGATGGFFLSLVPAALTAIGLAHRDGETGLGTWKLTAAIMIPLILLSSASAAVSLFLTRRVRDSRQLDREDIDVIAPGDAQTSVPTRAEASYEDGWNKDPMA
jgi:hypothetical protein